MGGKQLGFGDYEQATAKKRTKREKFLAEMDAVVPWRALIELIEPHYPKTGSKGGRPPYPLDKGLARQTTWMLQAETCCCTASQKRKRYGPSGVGKTHLAIAITMAMVAQDQVCRFFPATTLVQLLQKAKAA